MEVYQLGCRTAAGVKGLAEERIKRNGFCRETVEKALDEHMCCFGVRLVDDHRGG